MALLGSYLSYRVRTSEFQSLTETLKKTQTPDGSEYSRASAAANSVGSDFNKRASRIGLGIHETSQKIARLAKMTQKTSVFNDPTMEIEELTAVIKQDITALNGAFSDLQALQSSEIGESNCSKDSATHFTAIVDDLNGRLKCITKELKDVLITRMPLIDNSNNSQLRRRIGVDGTAAILMDGQMQQQLTQPQDTRMHSMATALQNVESTISELGNIFTQLATMVAQQGELAIRIDDNMDDTLSNVEGAQGALLKHLSRISSNRGENSFHV